MDPSKIKSNGPFDMHREYADRDIVQDTEIYYFDSNTYDANYDFKIEIYFIHLATL